MQPKHRAGIPSHRYGWFALASLAATLVLTFALWRRSPELLPRNLVYEVTASGLAQTRARATSSQTIRAYPHTRVRIFATPLTGAVAGLELGLYRERHGHLQRIPKDLLEVDRSRASAIFTALATDLAGSEPGVYTLYLLVARQGDLPRRFEQGQVPGAGLNPGARRLGYHLSMQILPSPDL